MTLTLVYWDLRAMGEVSRYLLRYSGVKWVDRRIPLTKEGYNEWWNEKYSCGLDLPNLPYLVDGDVKISQSVAINRYLGRKFQLVPTDPAAVLKCDMVEQEANDFRVTFQNLIVKNQEEFGKAKPEFLEKTGKRLEMLDKYVGDGPFVLGEKLSYVDFMVFEYVSQIQKMAPEFVDNAPNIAKLLTTVQNLPELQDYFSGEEFKKGTLINPAFTSFPG